jgi:hypothetical protein
VAGRVRGGPEHGERRSGGRTPTADRAASDAGPAAERDAFDREEAGTTQEALSSFAGAKEPRSIESEVAIRLEDALIVLGLAAALSSACGDGSDCPLDQTTLDLEIGVADPVARALVQSVWVELTVESLRARRLYPAGTAFEQGLLSVRVVLDTPLPADGHVAVAVRANNAIDGTGTDVAEVTGQIAIQEHLCNHTEIDLEPTSVTK